jgi:hypothetical protein
MNPSRSFNAFPHLEQLLVEFEQCKLAALQLPSTNLEDDSFIRCGMIGFARHLPLTHWTHESFQYVRALRDEVSDGQFSKDWQSFTCLAAGYFLGMKIAGALSEVNLRHAEAQTPGFMWLHAESFDPPLPT